MTTVLAAIRSRLGPLVRVLLSLLPDRLVNRMLRSRGWSDADLTVPTPPRTPIRLFVGPVNSAGQGWAWARAVERDLEGVGAVDLAITTAGSAVFAFPADHLVPETAYVFASGWRKRQHRTLVEGFTHILLESGRFAYGNVPGYTPTRTALDLAAEGPRIALLWHGSDIRLPSLHAQHEPDSPFGPGGGYPADRTAILERNALVNRGMIEQTSFPVFVSTPDLLTFAPRSEWLPVVVDPDQWSRAASRSPLTRGRPVVVHAPSNAGIKGSAQIRPALVRLHDAGLIEYRELSGVASSQMPAAYGEADIVLDQFLIGGYGVAAVEAMAAGRVVVGHVDDAARLEVERRTGYMLPIVESRHADVEDVIRDIVSNGDTYRELAARGAAFAREVHGGRRSAQVLAEFLGATLQGKAHA